MPIAGRNMLPWIALCPFALTTIAAVGCSPQMAPGGSGTGAGGTLSGSGGNSGTGGAIGSGGSNGSGGLNGSGGASGGSTNSSGGSGPATGGSAPGSGGGTSTGGIGSGGFGSGGVGSGGQAAGGMSGSGGGARDGGIDVVATGGMGAGGQDGGTTDGPNPTGSSAGCGKTVTRPDPAVQLTMQINGTTRYYLLYLPTNYVPTKALPVIFAFHGLNMNNVWTAGDSASQSYGAFRFKALSNNQAILIFPQGAGDAPGTTPKCGGCSGGAITAAWNGDAADLAFFDGMVADVENKYCVDTNRIFSSGFSMGGAFSNTLGCQRGDVLRAIAPVSGWGPGSAPTSGTPSCSNGKGDVSALLTHGTADSTIPYSIGQASGTFWRTRNGCTATTTAGAANCIVYQGCRDGLPVTFCSHSGNHQVPTAAGTNIWNFFSGLL